MPIKFEDVVHVDPLSRTQRKQITAKTACQEVEKKVQQTKPHFYEDENAFKRKFVPLQIMEDSYQKELDSLSIEMKQQLIKLEELTSEYLNLKSSSFRQFLKNEIVRLSEKHLMSAKYAVTIERSAANFYEFSHKRSNPVIDTAYQRLQQSHLLKAIDAENYRSKIQIVVEGKIFEAWV